ncbi:dTMP kinase [Colwellia psychrerythraea]|mgnify:CR=1 FL=1|uniref:Thymidylate kinase n=1 Tax=Colwellia psychrerythraea TaxID=28229 RepID=A0A1Y5EQI6_COLPS|nr:dTMP kinase [Colwellia psychrerythraea]
MIVCDGSNGAGKSTLIKSIEGYLKSKKQKVLVTREPGGTPIGEGIRHILLNPDTPEMCDTTELMLFAAARAQHIQEKILPNIQDGRIVICDRFDSATVSFQHYARGLPLSLINQLNEIALDGFRPDITIILDLDPLIGLERVKLRGEGLDRLEKQDMEFLNRARDGYLKQAENDPEHFAIIDASQPIKKVESDVFDILDKLLMS